jgi:hypothetical protein
MPNEQSGDGAKMSNLRESRLKAGLLGAFPQTFTRRLHTTSLRLVDFQQFKKWW